MRCGDPKRSGQRCLSRNNGGFRFLGRFRGALGMLVKACACVGRLHGTGRPVEQPRAEMLFQFFDALANGRLAKAEIPRGGRETSAFDDTGEDTHGGKEIHGCVYRLLR